MVDFISLLYVIFMPRVSLPGRYGSATRYKKARTNRSRPQAARRQRLSNLVEIRRIELLSEIHPHHKALSQ